MKFIIYTQDKPDSLNIRQANRDDHITWLKAVDADVKLLTAGPWLDDEGIMRGSLLIVEASKKTDIEDWLTKDPYRAAGLTRSTQIKGYIWAIGAPD